MSLSQVALSLVSTSPWIKQVADIADLDEYIRNIASTTESRLLIYDPYRYELLLADISRLLDRCLAYRREFNELVGNAVRQGLEYKLFKAQRPVLEQLDAAEWLKDLRDLESRGQTTVAQRFGEAVPNNPLASGLKENAETAVLVSKKGADAELLRNSLVKTKWQLLATHQEELELRHTMPGHPLNFAERALRIRWLLEEDFKEAASKAVAVAYGVELVHEINSPLTWLKASSPLDEFIKWTRDIIRELDRRSNFDLEYFGEMRLNVADFTPAPNGTKTISVINDYLRIPNRSNGPNRRETPLKNIRLRDVGARLIMKNMTNMTNGRYMSCNLKMYREPENFREERQEPFYLIGVSTRPDYNSYHVGSSLYNMVPYSPTSKWNITIESDSASDKEAPAFTDSVEQILFVFRMVGYDEFDGSVAPHHLP